jgi:hypothetical protein
MVAGAAVAQDRHFAGGFGGGRPPQRPIGPRTPPSARPFFGSAPFIGAGYWGGYDSGGYAPFYPESAPPVNNTIVFAPPPVFVAPPEPIHSSIQDLKPAPSNAPPAFYVVALKNGSRFDAAAVWVQGNDLRYVDGDDQNRRVPLADLDRAATRELNQARNLVLRLPPPQQ